ncbi:hypothetical protein AJ80_00634 [Polytolypa hystricis UAMH7299]|uniref:NmrA-like domain-containing protein n=1 Tax=Polytolypa hystricis (strain UAMH7299) TaxID=1447883 RepID=A0A2B7Z2P1_POLH7|nr:hypothetical protein AJ80_00634 [Polytolypa hystricis UAMH7299]
MPLSFSPSLPAALPLRPQWHCLSLSPPTNPAFKIKSPLADWTLPPVRRTSRTNARLITFAEITCLIRTSSADKPAAQALKGRRDVTVVTGDLSAPIDELAARLRGIDTVISIVFPLDLDKQIPLVDASVRAGVKRFLPCNWGTPAPRGGIMGLRDSKEEVHDHIFRARLGFTIIDIGYWYESSFPRVPSGKFDSAIFIPMNEVYAGGTVKNMLMHRKDVGRFAARVIKDPRTLNKRVYAYGDLLSQNEINAIVEEKTGEKLELTQRSLESIRAALKEAQEAERADPELLANKYKQAIAQYSESKYVRADNTPESAEYLGYINGRELYPDLNFISFAEFVDELIEGSVQRPYPHIQL